MHTASPITMERYCDERRLASDLDDILAVHPAMPWIRCVPGLDARLAARLLCLLDIRKARWPSAFWSFCGLATVAAYRVRCPSCGRETLLAEGSPLPSLHTDPETGRDCAARAQRVPGSVAARLPQKQRGNDGVPSFNGEAKSLCRSIGDGLRAAGHRYTAYHDLQRQLLEISRPGWESGRRHVNASRRLQKLFLTHLYLVWAEALDLPIPVPHVSSQEHVEWGSPWTMISKDLSEAMPSQSQIHRVRPS